MTRKSNLYHNLVRNENTLTELLANLLQFESFRDLFAGLIAEKAGLSNFSFRYADVETQKKLAGQSQPDLIIETESFCVLVECKIVDACKLTENQPVSYLKYLDTLVDKQGALVFLVPYYYEHEALIRKHMPLAIKTPLKVICWNDLIERLEGQVQISAEDIAIQHFLALLHARFDYKQIIFTEEEMKMMQDPQIPAFLIKIVDLIEEINNKFPKSFRTEQVYNEYGFGYDVTDQEGNYLLWFGCGLGFWNERRSFLQIGVGDDGVTYFDPAIIKRFKEKFGQEAIWYKPWEWYLYPIPEDLIKDPHNVKQLVRFITDVVMFCGNIETTTE